MVKRENAAGFGETNNNSESKTANFIRYSTRLASGQGKSNKDASSSDELIGSLSDAYENKRARQVFEWETARRQSVYRSA